MCFDCLNNSSDNYDSDSSDDSPGNLAGMDLFQFLRFGQFGGSGRRWGPYNFQKQWATSEQRAEAIERIASGKETRAKIAADLGFSTSSLARWWKQHQRAQGIEVAPRKPKTKMGGLGHPALTAPVKTVLGVPGPSKVLGDVTNKRPPATTGLSSVRSVAKFPNSMQAMKRLRDGEDEVDESSKRPRLETVENHKDSDGKSTL
ncbi:uncharacterized protein LOC132200477 [Neocloeon triangulifer]|uniref:uncharacterized protein LOC132200477 n=1 Tax=Neocloeon triangulifer TaxID=2078957 RepID=UPI00286F915B|nr:uncharacterized protein LOC132200477 [Neocloeon triangulifer]